jgi:hypothetical protein
MRSRTDAIIDELDLPALLLLAISAVAFINLGLGDGGGAIGEATLTIVDQEGRTTPFFLTNSDSTEMLRATIVLEVPEGSMMPYPGASFVFRTPSGDPLFEVYEEFAFAGFQTFIAECTLPVNLSSFPPESDPYSLSVTAGTVLASTEFHFCGREETTPYLEDFAEQDTGVLPDDWAIVSPGYGTTAQWVEELVFEDGDKVLRITSYFKNEADLRRPINLTGRHIKIGFRIRIWEEEPPEDGSSAMSFGLETDSGRIALVELSGTPARVIVPFDQPYAYNDWMEFEIYLDMSTAGTSASVYHDGHRAGTLDLPALEPGNVTGIGVTLGGGSYYVAQIDDLQIREYDLDAGTRDWPAASCLLIAPSHGQWFDPSSIVVTLEVEVVPCMGTNPYLVVDGVDLELWGDAGIISVLGRTAWNGTPSCSFPCRPFTHRYSCRVPTELLLVGPFSEPKRFIVRTAPDDPSLPLLSGELEFWLDDPMDAHFSLGRGAQPVTPAVFRADDLNLSMNIEFDPHSIHGDVNLPFVDNHCRIAWIDPEGETILNQTSFLGTHPSYPSNNSWAHGILSLKPYFPAGDYQVQVSAVCNSGFRLVDTYGFTISESAILSLAVLTLLAAGLHRER